MATEKRLDPDVLETSVFELIECTKTKMGELSSEIAALRDENEQLGLVVSDMKSEAQINASRLAKADGVLRSVQGENVDLNKQLAARQDEFRRGKGQLAKELEKTETQNAEIREKVKSLEEQGKGYKGAREAEMTASRQRLVMVRRNISKLGELVALRDEEIAKLRTELQTLVAKESARLQKLETEKTRLQALFANI